ncbi:hypothetical protein [Rufibacter sp. XAAS-G3-1]|uniref:hypothetical protein n=1 Tax=Rufibacter sp. XAAS-G3-1 TaxID=2729134 RepID=UPI0015E7C0EB|nr:hypothetical protein [Rufibacter sp. XAAS-G3-1]
MKREEAIAIIDALAAGCSPFTGEVLEGHPILNDRNVIRALQTALVSLSAQPSAIGNTIPPAVKLPHELSKETVRTAIELLQENGFNTTFGRLTKFFLGSRHFEGSPVAQSPLFGSFKGRYRYNSFKPLVLQVLQENPDLRTTAAIRKQAAQEKPWDSVVYFTGQRFCKLSAKALDQLKSRIEALGIQKPTATLADNQVQARLSHPRAYEPWSEQESEFLAKALFYTNDLQVLSSCFQRTESSLSAMGKKLIYEGKAATNPDAQA